jgi:hypothetical protein
METTGKGITQKKRTWEGTDEEERQMERLGC